MDFLDDEQDDINDSVEELPIVEHEVIQPENVDMSEEIGQEVDDADQLVKPAIQKPISNSDPYATMLQEYKRLQEQKNSNQRLVGLLRAGAGIGQAIAGGVSGNFNTDLSGFDYLNKMTEAPVQDFENQVKMQPQITGIRDQDQMRDPSSAVSEFYRQMALKRGFDPQMVEGKSAWDLSEMSKVLGRPQQAGKSFQQVRIRNPQTGVIETRLVNMQTGEVGNSVGEAGFAQQVRVNPRSGETIVVNPASGQQVGALSGPAPQTPEAAQAKVPEVNRENLTVSQQKRLDDARKELLDDTKDTRGQLEAAKNINGMINTGGSIDIDFVRAIQNQLARASGERGAMTEGDVAGFGGSPAIMDSLKRWVSLKSFGKLPEDDKKRLTGLAKLMQARAEAYMKQRTAYFTNNMYQDLKAAPNFQGAQIAPQSVEKLIGSDVYTNPNFGKVPVVEIATGKRGFIPEDRVEEAIKSGKFKRVDQ